MYERIFELCLERNVTIAELARATGISESAFANAKRRKGAMSFENAKKVAEYFGVSLDELAAKK